MNSSSALLDIATAVRGLVAATEGIRSLASVAAYPPMHGRRDIATQVLAGLAAVSPWQAMTHEELVQEAYKYADALIRLENLKF